MNYDSMYLDRCCPHSTMLPYMISQNETNTLSICDRQRSTRGAREMRLGHCFALGEEIFSAQYTGTDLAQRDQQRQAYSGRDHV